MWVVLYMHLSRVSRLFRRADASAERCPATPTRLVLGVSSICSVLPHLSCSYLFVPSILSYLRRLIVGSDGNSTIPDRIASVACWMALPSVTELR